MRVCSVNVCLQSSHSSSFNTILLCFFIIQIFLSFCYFFLSFLLHNLLKIFLCKVLFPLCKLSLMLEDLHFKKGDKWVPKSKLTTLYKWMALWPSHTFSALLLSIKHISCAQCKHLCLFYFYEFRIRYEIIRKRAGYGLQNWMRCLTITPSVGQLNGCQQRKNFTRMLCGLWMIFPCAFFFLVSLVRKCFITSGKKGRKFWILK